MNKLLRYIIRSVKYFIYLAVVLTLVLLILTKAGFAEGNIDTMFVEGKRSLLKIAGIMAAFAAVYPKLGYSTRQVNITGSDEEVYPRLREVMNARDYKEESFDGQTITFVKRSPLARLLKSFEDRLTFTRTIYGFDVEGLTKDSVRVISSLETRSEE